FYGNGYFQYGHLKKYSNLRECHERIHLLGQELYNLSVSEHQDSVKSRIDELRQMHQQFIQQLNELVKQESS
ncbi:MAG: hypothetical protein ABW107_20340, partial [Candidatus Thiodiazotropha sp. 6PLUC5]